MAKFNVGVQGIEDSNRGANFNLQVDASNVVEALKKAQDELGKVLEAAGLTLKPSPAVDPTTPAS